MVDVMIVGWSSGSPWPLSSFAARRPWADIAVHIYLVTEHPKELRTASMSLINDKTKIKYDTLEIFWLN
jgi:hypothetical protein